MALAVPRQGRAVSVGLVVLALPHLIPWNAIGTIRISFSRPDIGLTGYTLNSFDIASTAAPRRWMRGCRRYRWRCGTGRRPSCRSPMPDTAMDDRAREMDRLMARLERAGVQGEYGPRLNPEIEPEQRLKRPGAPKAKLENEKPQGVTVRFETLREASQQGKAFPEGIGG